MSKLELATAPAAFFEGETVEVARALLGAYLVHDTGGESGLAGRSLGRIVETEAYLSVRDDASHSARGPGVRNASMFLGPGHAYVYRIYGVHWCFNVVTAARGVGEAVLVRALEPLEGFACMRRRRGRERELEWCRGPGRLTQALGIRGAHDGLDLTRGALALHDPGSASPPVSRGRRVGITRSADRLLRFAVRGERWVSRPPCGPGANA